MKTNDIKLPLAYSSHRQIVDADGVVVIEVRSGGCGTDAADQLQELVAAACNAYAPLVKALQEIAKDAHATAAELDAEAAFVALDDIARSARETLTAAGVA
jgi:hypothetical protein